MTMALNAYSGYSCLLQEEIAAVFTTIAAVRDLAGPNVAVTAVDVSSRDARARAFLPAMYDAGEITFDIVYDPDADTHSDTVAGGLLHLQKDQTVCNWKLVLPDNGPLVVETVKGTAGADEIQTVTVRSGGTNIWTFGVASTLALAWDISTADLQTALQALATIGAGNVTVAGTPGVTYTLTFVGALDKEDVAMVVVTAVPRTVAFSAFVTNFSLETPLDDGMTANLTLKVTGAPTWA